jgi:hypothetical protein
MRLIARFRPKMQSKFRLMNFASGLGARAVPEHGHREIQGGIPGWGLKELLQFSPHAEAFSSTQVRRLVEYKSSRNIP